MQEENMLLKNCFNVIKQRGFFYQSTGESEVETALTTRPTTIYLGIDPTADSLHIGHCYPLFMLKHLQKAGHKIVILIGGATAMIGDPTGRSDMRQLITEKSINENLNKIETIISKFLNKDGNNPFVIVNNYDWFKNLNYVNFMRDVGVHFNVNKMLATDAYATRLEEGGLTFFDMGYMLMQAYDFVHLNKNLNCTLQVGGSDQWANMLAGVELGKKLGNLQGEKSQLHAFTVPLLTTSDGVKMGKTQKGAIWVDESKTSPFEFFQYFYNIADTDVEKLFKSTTDLPLNQIKQIMQGDIVVAKERFAFEITKAVHGEEKAAQARETAKKLFLKDDWSSAPQVQLSQSQLPQDICDLVVFAKLETSKSKARKLIEQNGLTLNGEKVKNFDLAITKSVFKDGSALLKKGKKTFVKVVLK